MGGVGGGCGTQSFEGKGRLKFHFSYVESRDIQLEALSRLSLLVFTLRQQKFHSLMAVSQK